MNSNCISKIVALSSAFLCACASPTVVQSVKPGDSGLSCSQLQNEYADAENLKKEAGDVKGVTGGNVARLLFWPSIIGTYMNANEAIAAADNRKVHLLNQMNLKNCAIPVTQQSPDNKVSDSTQPTATTSQPIEVKLTELKRLYDANLITKEVYEDRQKAILKSP